MSPQHKTATIWALVSATLVIIFSVSVGAAYDLNHDHANVVGLHMGFYIGVAASCIVGGAIWLCRYIAEMDKL